MLVRRHYRIGLVRAALDTELHLLDAPRRANAAIASLRMVSGAFRLGRNVRGPRHAQVDAILWFASGVGRVAGLLGLWFEEYR